MKKTVHKSGEKNKRRGSGCSFYNETDFKRYLCGAMTPLEIERLLAHCETCGDCRKTLYHCQQEMDKAKDAELIKRTLDLLDRLDK